MKNLKLFLLIIAISAIFSSKSFAEELQVEIIVSESPNFISEWMGSSYSHSPRITRIKEVEGDQMFYMAVVVGGYGLDSKNFTDITGDFMLLEPDGSVSLEDKNIFKHRIEMNKDRATGFIMLDPTLDIVLEKGDPQGIYTLRITVEDNALSKKSATEYEITLKAKSKGSKQPPIFNSHVDLSKWMTYYYLNPEPNKLPAVLKYYASSSLYNKISSRLPAIQLFATILRNNEALLEEVYKSITPSSPDNLQTVFLRTLWLLNTTRSKEIIAEVSPSWKSEENKKQIKDINQTPAPEVLIDPIIDPSQLDMLWSVFLASGDSEPINKIISALSFVEDEDIMQAMVGKAAVWSLGSNIKQHNLVYEICKKALSTTDSGTAVMLQEIIDNMDLIK